MKNIFWNISCRLCAINVMYVCKYVCKRLQAILRTHKNLLKTDRRSQDVDNSVILVCLYHRQGIVSNPITTRVYCTLCTLIQSSEKCKIQSSTKTSENGILKAILWFFAEKKRKKKEGKQINKYNYFCTGVVFVCHIQKIWYLTCLFCSSTLFIEH